MNEPQQGPKTLVEEFTAGIDRMHLLLLAAKRIPNLSIQQYKYFAQATEALDRAVEQFRRGMVAKHDDPDLDCIRFLKEL